MLLGAIVPESISATSFNIIKGLGFVLVTSGLLYWMLRREFDRREKVESRLRMIQRAVSNLEEGIIVTDHREEATPDVVYVNPAYERITGYASDELIGRPPPILSRPDTSQDTLNRIHSAPEAGKSLADRTVNFRKDGSSFIADWEMLPVPDRDGAIGNWVTVVHDVTERVRAEQELQEAEQRYRHIVEEVPAVIYTIRADEAGGAVEFISPQIEGLLRYPLDQWKENPYLWRERIHPDDRERVMKDLAHHFEVRTPFRAEYRVFTRDEKVIWVQDEAIYDPDSDETPRWRGVITDITNIKQVERELSKNLSRLAALRAIDNAITSNLEIRHILNVVVDQVVAQLHVDSAAIYLVDERTGTLTYKAGIGMADLLANQGE
ncbi:MAG: PAS domain S-box protein, partial [Chloroflexota bacterium]